MEEVAQNPNRQGTWALGSAGMEQVVRAEMTGFMMGPQSFPNSLLAVLLSFSPFLRSATTTK
jgi:hypothetical protein